MQFNNDVISNDQFDNPIKEHSRGFDSPFATVTQNTVLSKAFLWMFAGLLISALSAFGGALYIFYNIESIAKYYEIFMLVCVIVEFVLVISFTKNLETMSASRAKGMFFLYSAINGFTFSSIFFVFDMFSIISTFLATSVMFLVTSLIGSKTNKNLDSIGPYLIGGLFALIVSSIINILFLHDALGFIISIIGIILFVGLTIYDVNKIKIMSERIGVDSTENANKLAIYGAFQLYLDFINIFIKLLRIFGKRRN